MQPNHHTLAPVSRDSMGILSAWTCHIHSCNHREHSCSSFLKPYGHYGGILTTPSVYIKLCSVRVFRVCVRPLPLFTQPVQQKGCVNILKLGYRKGKMHKRTNHSEAALWLVDAVHMGYLTSVNRFWSIVSEARLDLPSVQLYSAVVYIV